MLKPVHESLKLAEATAGDSKTGRMTIQVMSPGWGASGYYSPQVCESAATLVAVGTQMFIDHPHQDGSGVDERGNRSVRDIAAVITEAGRWDPTAQAVLAECRVTAPYREFLADPDLAPHIGLSLRGAATDITVGEAEGRSGPIIEGLANISSVDFVTRAGRGGKVMEVLESALGDALTEAASRLQVAEARNVGQWIESRLHLELTRIADDMFGDGRLTRPERISLSSAVGDALTAFVSNLETTAPDLYKRDLWAEPTALLAASEARHVPVSPGSTTHPTTKASQEGPMGNKSIEESEYDRLVAESNKVAAAEQRVAELEAAEAARLQEARDDRAAEILDNAADTAHVTFSARESRDLLATLPLKESALDEAAFTTTVSEAVAAKLKAAGKTGVRGFGGDLTPVAESDDDDTYTIAQAERAIAEAFGRPVTDAGTQVKEA